MHKTLAIIGLGYVGLPLAIEFGKKYKTLGFDINPKRIQALQKNQDQTSQITQEEFQKSKYLSFHSQIQDLQDAQIYIITVPTPLDSYKNPDISHLLNASKMIAPLLQKGDIIIYESTTYPTCTRLDCVPVLEKYSSLAFNQDFFVGYSPERINPSDPIRKLPDIQKITSGSTPQAAQEIDALYSSIVQAGTYLAPSIEVAEMAKAVENSQRDLNIAFVNEVALICDRLNLPTHEVLKSAGTKWNFLHFSPGLVGGHCISIDPYYLTHKAQQMGYHSKVISAGRLINDAMPQFIANKLIKLMSQKQIPTFGAKILILGATFKENCNDLRNSKVFDVIAELQDFGCKVSIFDPIAQKEELASKASQIGFENFCHFEDLPLHSFDALLVAVAHQMFFALDFTPLLQTKNITYDLKGMLKFADARL